MLHIDPTSRSSTERISPESFHRLSPNISHRRSNTLPSRRKQTETLKVMDEKTTHLSPTYKRKEPPVPDKINLQPFSPSLLLVQSRRPIRVIDDSDEGDSPSSSTINQDD